MTMAAASTNAQIAPRGALRVAPIVIAAIATLVAVAELPRGALVEIDFVALA